MKGRELRRALTLLFYWILSRSNIVHRLGESRTLGKNGNMRSVSSAFEAAIAAGNLQIAELYTITLASGEVFRYTSHDQDIVWDAGSNTYLAAMPLNRGEAGYHHTGEFDDVELVLGNIEGDLSDRAMGNALEAATLTCKRVRWNAPSYAAAEEITVFVGPVNVKFDRKVLLLSCRPSISSLNIQVPAHSWQENCNYALFDAGCTLTQSDYVYSGTATGGTSITLLDSVCGAAYKATFDDATGTLSIGDTVTGGWGAGTGVLVNIVYATATTGTIWFVEQTGVLFASAEYVSSGGNNVRLSAVPAEDTAFWEQGEIKMTSGYNNGERRQLFGHSGSGRTFTWAMPNAVIAGDAYDIYPGCDGLAVTCRDKFGNEANFRGFPYIPKVEETIFKDY